MNRREPCSDYLEVVNRMKVVADKNTGRVLMLESNLVWITPYEIVIVDIDEDQLLADENGEYYIELP